MPFIQENNIEINIGLKNEYKLIHFSDVHAVTYNQNDSKEVIDEAIRCENVWLKQKKDFANGNHEHYDDLHMISSKECLNNIVNYINEEKPIAVVLTGDIIDYYSEANYDLLLESCGNLNYPFVFACGNHESPVSRYVDLTANEEGFMVLEFNDFKIISLDDSTKKVSKYTLSSLKKELRSNKPVIIAMHIPVCTNYNQDLKTKYDPYFLIDKNETDEITKEFIDILENNDRIKAILCGHVHGHYESEFAPNKKEYMASSGLIGLVNRIIVK